MTMQTGMSALMDLVRRGDAPLVKLCFARGGDATARVAGGEVRFNSPQWHTDVDPRALVVSPVNMGAAHRSSRYVRIPDRFWVDHRRSP